MRLQVVQNEYPAHRQGMIDRFVEKPKEYVGNHINAGIYIFNTSMIKRIPVSISFSNVCSLFVTFQNKPTSIEREIFPVMAADKQLYNMVLEDFWMDIGQPKDYIKGMGLYLDYIRPHCDGINDSVFASGEGIEGHVLIVSKWVD